ncbi:MAG: hypothetical protein RLZZ584_1050 [Pseudomonadota bacterium]
MLSSTPRVIFHVRNRRGLGHMMRGLNMALALRERSPQVQLLFHLRAAPAPGFWPDGIAHVVDDGRGAAAAVAAFGPQVQVFDTMLPDRAALASLRAAAPASRLAFVMRRCLPEEQAAVYAHPSLSAMDCVLVPHTPAEFGMPVPASLRPRCHFVGPIARLPQAQAQARIVERHGLRSDEFVLTSTVGGGGFADQADTFFEAVRQVHLHVSSMADTAPWRHIVVLGPNYTGRFEPLPGMTVVHFEPDLVNLLAASSLVIAEGGYNTVSELALTRTPALFLPSRRGKDDQFERVQRLADAGCARVFDAADAAGIAAALMQLRAAPAQLADMRRCYPSAAAPVGNARAARLLEALAVQAMTVPNDRAGQPSPA